MLDTELDHELRILLEAEGTSIPDNGFSRRVLASLPLRAEPWWRRDAIVAGMTLLGCLVGLFAFPGGEFLRALLQRLPQTHVLSALPVAWLVLVYASCAAFITSPWGAGQPRRDGI